MLRYVSGLLRKFVCNICKKCGCTASKLRALPRLDAVASGEGQELGTEDEPSPRPGLESRGSVTHLARLIWKG